MQNASEPAAELSPVPPLPARLTDIRPVVYIGTAAWLIALLIVLLSGRRGEPFWITLCGFGLGFVGLGISEWQRAASRRGSRSAQTGF